MLEYQTYSVFFLFQHPAITHPSISSVFSQHHTTNLSDIVLVLSEILDLLLSFLLSSHQRASFLSRRLVVLLSETEQLLQSSFLLHGILPET